MAAAPEDDVLKLWQGLGYYSRARNLHAAAKSMGGTFPSTYAGVLALKGVGEYTAAAICSFAYRMPYAVVDGNVYRVLSRVYGISTPVDSSAGKKEFAAMAQKLLDKTRPDLFNQAIMEFGALQCACRAGLRPLSICQTVQGVCGQPGGATACKSIKNTSQRALLYLYICRTGRIYLA